MRSGSGDPIASAGRRHPAATALLAFLLIVLGVLLAYGWTRRQASTTAYRPEADLRLEELRGALATERRAREALEGQVAELRARVDAQTTSGGAIAPTGPPDAAPGSASGSAAAATTARGAAGAPTGGTLPGPLAAGDAKPAFDEPGLLAAGMPPSDVHRLRERWQRFELDRLELGDRAMREGYFMTPRHGDEHRALVSAFQSDVGEEGYEAYLFATGQENRVVVQDVLPNSAAGAAGLQAADEIVRYDSAPVYSTADLQFRTAAGTRGELVTLDVVRGGQTITLRTPRGPLGVMLAGARRPPSTH